MGLKTSLRHLWRRPRYWSCRKTPRRSTSIMFEWLKSWEVVWREAKSCRAWCLVGNPKVHCRLTFCYTRTDVSSWSGDVKKATKAKVAVFTNPIDITQTETKGTVLIKNADDMLNFTRGEEKHMEKVSISTFAHACRSLTPARSYSKSSPTRV